MPIDRPTEEEIRDLGLNLMRQKAGSSFIARYQATFIYPLFAAFAKMIDLLFAYVDRVFKDRWIYSATEEALYNRHLPFTQVQRIDAAKATGQITFTGSDDAEIPADTFVVTNEGLRFKTLASATIASGSALVNAEAENVGLSYNVLQNATLFLETDIQGIDETATVAANFTGGKDIESVDSWRDRMRDRVSKRSGTGSKSDILGWITDAIGDVRGFSFGRYPENGKISISYVALNPDNIAPTSQNLTTAQTYVQARVSQDVIVETISPASRPFDFILRIDPNTQEVRDAIQNSLKEWFMLNSEVSVDQGGGNNDLYKIPISQLREAISIAAGEVRHELTQVAYSGTPETGTEIIIPHQNLASLGNITYQSYS
jgi:uncharacterized phage protein gp47/JayE